MPGAHVVITSPQIIGGPLTQSQFFTTTKFADANPKVIDSIKAASLEAIEFIKKDPRAAVMIYKEVMNDKTNADDLVEMLVPIYMKNLDDDDVAELVRFYSSPTGQRFLDKQPMIMQESMKAGQAWGERMAQEAMDEMNKSEGTKQ